MSFGTGFQPNCPRHPKENLKPEDIRSIRLICVQKQKFVKFVQFEEGDMERTNVVIQNWMRLKDTIEFLGFWKQLSNPNFNCIEFEAIKASAGVEQSGVV